MWLSRASSPEIDVLVISGDHERRAQVRGELEREGHAVDEADDGASALAQLPARDPAAVVLWLDATAPDALELCARLTAHPSGVRPVLVVDGQLDIGARRRLLDAGVADCVSAHVDPRELALRIGALLRARARELQLRAELATIRQLDSLKDDLVALVAHDLRSPIAGLGVLLHTLTRKITDPSIQQDLGAALRATERVRETVDDMLEVRALEAGKISMRRRTTPIDVLVHDAIETLRDLADGRGITIIEDHEDGLAADVDVKLFRRAFENLVANAIKYSRDGDPVYVRTRRTPRAIELEVADRGPGIPDDAKASLFKKFGFSSSVHRRGHGLGLYFVHLVASAHGGDVVAEDHEGGGTRLLLSVPVLRAPKRDG
ncbi:ATP-binding protein [Myxococcota bacterium]|nr:ATP-binding protein [Myxococcota bacterium]